MMSGFGKRPLFVPMLAAILVAGLSSPSWGASQASYAANGIEIISPSGGGKVLTPAQILALPAVTVPVSFGTDHGPLKATFSGPLLWTVLRQAAADPKNPKLALREFVLVTGADGFAAVVALGEIAPAFEDKDVILATRMNGQMLAPGHFRIVVPGDKRGGRSVRDVVSIAVSLAGPKPD
jgi:hypothetical protein